VGKKLYVGNLSYETTDASLEQLFAPFGEVRSAQVIQDRDTGRSKGFGFVEMSDDNAARAAIQALNEKSAAAAVAVVAAVVAAAVAMAVAAVVVAATVAVNGTFCSSAQQFRLGNAAQNKNSKCPRCTLSVCSGPFFAQSESGVDAISLAEG
jgi:RNA recognition motif-containing protein